MKGKKKLNLRQMFYEVKVRFTKREGKWSTSESTDGERARERERKEERQRECMKWDMSMTWPSWKISTGKSIWEWVRLTLTLDVQPVTSWEKSSWQRIRILETCSRRGSEKHSSAHLKTHTRTNHHAQHSAHADRPHKRACETGGSHAHSWQHCASALSDIHTRPDIRRLPCSSQIRQIHCLVWLYSAAHPQEAVRKIFTLVALTEGGAVKRCAVEVLHLCHLVNYRLLTDFFYIPNTLKWRLRGHNVSCWHYSSVNSSHAGDKQ